MPGYPVYYDPRSSSNYFFYDGAYWVFQGDNWYVSSWYNGPWQLVAPDYVPTFVLRVPVRYYRSPPPYFRAWYAHAPPRWGKHWGREWERSRAGWDRWDHRDVPRPAPLPAYQARYSGDRYPSAPEHQQSIRAEQYRYRAREVVTREHFENQGDWNGTRGDRHVDQDRRRDDHDRAPDRGQDRGGHHDNGRDRNRDHDGGRDHERGRW